MTSYVFQFNVCAHPSSSEVRQGYAIKTGEVEEEQRWQDKVNFKGRYSIGRWDSLVDLGEVGNKIIKGCVVVRRDLLCALMRPLKECAQMLSYLVLEHQPPLKIVVGKLPALGNHKRVALVCAKWCFCKSSFLVVAGDIVENVLI